MLAIVLKGEPLVLLPERAMWWPGQKTLILSDLHWGKGAHFRKNGIAIPVHAQTNDGLRIAELVARYNAERLIVAGDMFHSRQNKETDNFGYWRNAHTSLHIDLVIGNHDILLREQYDSWNIRCHDVYTEMPFSVIHDHEGDSTSFVIQGHVHPALRITGKGNQSMRLSCFCQDEQRLILPSFGSFTGSHIVAEADFQHLYVIAGDKVIQWK